ncbi:DUF7331 family protein [Halobellus limi]|jgi:hypothetical protein|uniref:Uncharacterized protein n=1 Tax=Halobellus limi TaxID=699433 RepID=A0A1H5Z1C7_9EURY|nr:hypothetical protein [Halobellus limi]QCC48276.1 hypothetical protein DV707_11725 [Halobellus limi]SEG29457.1 hypothetical protein SAMN04488133_1788 [Halobellus limi]
MVDPADSERTDRSPAAPARVGEASGLAEVESYDVDGGVVFYDPENPLAWVEASRTVTLTEHC